MATRPVVVISPFAPYEGVPHAGGQFLLAHLTRMCAAGPVTLVVPDVAENRVRGPEGLRVHRVPVPRVGPLRRAVDLARDQWTYLTPGRRVLGALRKDRTTAELVREAGLVEVQFVQLLPLLPALTGSGAPVVVHVHDVASQSVQRRAAQPGDPLRRAAALRASRRVVREERRLLDLADLVVVFSAKDGALVEQAGVAAPVHVLDPYVEHPVGPVGPSSDQVVLFVGAMSRPENWRGVLWFLDHVWPLVSQAVPAARFEVVGDSPPAVLRRRESPAVAVTGRVDDLDARYRAARVAVAPVLTGAGVKFKVPQAMAFGLPVVATTVGAEGLAATAGSGELAAVTDDPAEFATAVVRCLLDQEHAGRVGAAAARFVTREFDFDRSHADLLTRYAALPPRGPG